MHLQLATVLSNHETSCVVQPLTTKKTITAQYAKPMRDHGILAHPRDLVVITQIDQSYQLLFRWKHVVVENIANNQLHVRDHIGQQYPLPLAPEFKDQLSIGDGLFTDNTAVIDTATNTHPTHPDQFRTRYFPQIRAMYQKIERIQTIDSKQIVANGYDQAAEQHEAWSHTVRVAERERYTDWVLENLPQGASVLDLGCGTGTLTTTFLAERFQLTGVDISQKHIEMAQVAVPNATFIHADMTTLDFPAASFDGIVSFYALFHLPREEQAMMLQQIATWLRAGGLFIGTLGFKSNSGDIDDNWLGTTMYWSSYDGATNQRLVEEAGLEIVQANVETAVEFDKPITFLWIIAQKPTA